MSVCLQGIHIRGPKLQSVKVLLRLCQFGSCPVLARCPVYQDAWDRRSIRESHTQAPHDVDGINDRSYSYYSFALELLRRSGPSDLPQEDKADSKLQK